MRVSIRGYIRAKPGTPRCQEDIAEDSAPPRNVSHRVANERGDVLVMEGGVVEVPGAVNPGFGFS